MNNENNELNVNKEKREEFEQLMQESSTNLDGYWDKQNPFVSLLFLVLGLIIVAGVVYYGIAYFGK